MSNNTIKVEMDMPVPPEGFRYKAYRAPLNGEHYRLPSGRVAKAECDHPFDIPAPILERVPWVPKPGEFVFWHSAAGRIHEIPFGTATTDLEIFRTKEDAQKFATESRALADRIRVESEATNG